jgi:cellulose synthase/poly-beta-1,6-N-acetylglucosamine synthase-like glycosyltransferase
MKLLIAIPALNEEDSIANIIQRSLQARDHICRHSSVSEIAITVVSDGSTDRTVEIASQYSDQIDLIVFPQNRGYGRRSKRRGASRMQQYWAFWTRMAPAIPGSLPSFVKGWTAKMPTWCWDAV